MKTILRHRNSINPESSRRPIVVLIPGGPGLSSKTLIGLETLDRSFDLVFVDPPGTGGQNEPENPTFDSTLENIESALKVLERPIILLGHSFGGFQAAKLVERARLDVVGFVGCAAPLGEKTFSEISKQYEKLRTPELSAAEKAWENKKTKQTMKDWFASYGLLFFTPDSLNAGQRLIQQDDLSPSAFIGTRNGVSKNAELKNSLKQNHIRKLMIAGELDNLIPSNLLQSDAEATGMEFHIISKAGHFMNLDQPEAVAKLIEGKFIDSQKERKQ